MRKIYFYFLVFFAVCISICGCNSNEESPLDLVIISEIEARDIGDSGSSSDIFVSVSVENPENLTELRIVIIRLNELSVFDDDAASSLGPDRYQVIQTFASISDYSSRMDTGLKDSNGAEIINGVEYTVKILLVNGNEIRIANAQDNVPLSDEPYLQGKYVGSWDDNIYSNFGISADLTYSSGRLSGPFYYTGTFDSCCGGNDDGSIIMEIEEDGTIRNFRYNQVLIEFMGGCTGTYSGEGNIENYTELHIDFSGSDCEGPHTGGKIVLRKRELPA